MAESVTGLGFTGRNWGESGESWLEFQRQFYYDLDERLAAEAPMSFDEAEMYFTAKERILSAEERDRLSDALYELEREMAERILERGRGARKPILT